MSNTTHFLPCVTPGCFNMTSKGNYCDDCREKKKAKAQKNKESRIKANRTEMKTVVVARCEHCHCEFEPTWSGSSWSTHCKPCIQEKSCFHFNKNPRYKG